MCPMSLAQVRPDHSFRILRHVRLFEQLLRSSIMGLHFRATAADRGYQKQDRNRFATHSRFATHLANGIRCFRKSTCYLRRSNGLGTAGDDRTRKCQWIESSDSGKRSIHSDEGAIPALMFSLLSNAKLQGVTGLRLEALNHRDLPHTGPGRSSLGTWVVQETGGSRQLAQHDGVDKAKVSQCNGGFLRTGKQRCGRQEWYGPVAFLIDGNDAFKWKADRGIGRRNQPSVLSCNLKNHSTFRRLAHQSGSTDGGNAWLLSSECDPQSHPHCPAHDYA